VCGIAGVYNYAGREFIAEKVIVRMRDTMTHRGPDGAGLWVSEDGMAALAHRRLSIIDLSESAGQPMANEDGTVRVVFNGEIYNHMELRPELEKRGHRFKTHHSDTEVIIHAFEEWGIDCLEKFRGMFAIGIWDGRRKELWLIRDRIGVKPLYYARHNGRLVFASEIKAILAFPGMKRAVNEESLYHYLSFLTTPAPATLFAGIEKLPGGCWARMDAEGRLEVRRYWDVWEHTRPLAGIPEEEICRRILAELRTAVRYRKVSDVPVGIFLSGGIDSSLNTVLFAEGEKADVRTFSIGYDTDYKSYSNEFEYARTAAALAGSRHHERRLTVDDLIEFLPQLVYHQDEPIADPVCVPVYYVSRLARDNGVIVCQVGEGSDELFCGYPYWEYLHKLYRLNILPFPAVLKKSALFLLGTAGLRQSGYYELLRRGVCGEPLFWGGAEAFTEAGKKRLLSSRLRARFKGYSSYEALKEIEERFQAKAWEKSPLHWMSYLDLNLRLPELLLMRVDKMSMAASLEARVPFLDHKFVELAMSIPSAVKLADGKLKYILKKAARGLLPPEILNRKKQGFGVPVYEWFYDRLGAYAGQKIIDFGNRADYFDPGALAVLLGSGRRKNLWYILNFVLWHEMWIEGKN